MSEQKKCKLCGLPAAPPITSNNISGVFCCRGCRKIYNLIENQNISSDEVRTWIDQQRQEKGIEKDKEITTDAPDGKDVFFKIGGMHCSTCELFIEKSIERKKGVIGAYVNYTSEIARIIYNPDIISKNDVEKFIRKVGYTPYPPDAKIESKRKGRLLVGFAFGMMVMMVYLFYLYPIFWSGQNVDIEGLDRLKYLIANYGLWFFTTPIVFYSGYPFLRGAYVSVRARTPNMDVLVALAVLSAYFYSIYATLIGQIDVYFDVSTVLVLVIGVGKAVEGSLKRRASEAIQNTVKSKSEVAHHLVAQGVKDISPDDVETGDKLLIKEGERIPVDGYVLEGSSAVDEAIMTGEPKPITKTDGSEVMGGTVNLEAPLIIEASKPGSESTINRIVKQLWGVQSSRSSTQRLVDRIATYFIPVIITLSIITFLYHSRVNHQKGILIGISVLVASCPCAFGLATPLSLASGVRKAVKRGILIMNIEGFESAHDIDILILDKTRTLTEGGLSVSRINTFRGVSQDEIVAMTAAIETYSNHPLAESITTEADRRRLDLPTVEGFESKPGFGVSGRIDTYLYHVGSIEYMDEVGIKDVPEKIVGREREQGSMPVLVAREGVIIGIIVIEDTTRLGAKDLITDLKSRGIEVALATGDSEVPARKLADDVGIDTVYANVAPDEKSDVVRDFQIDGKKVGMVGDGTNDSLALAMADLGMAMGTSAALTTDSADIVLINDDLSGILTALDLSKETGRRVKQNLGWAFSYNVIAVPLAMLGLLNPLTAAFAMVGSSILVILNSIRLSHRLSHGGLGLFRRE